MEQLKNIIAKNLVNLRKLHGYTQFELAEKLNYSDKSISKWERGESIPDVAVLKEIADLFDVTLDYMVEEEHSKPTAEPTQIVKRKTYNRGFITGICILLVVLIAMTAFILADIIAGEKTGLHWLTFIYAIPATMVVWLVLNSIWFNKRRNFLIISLLMWSILLALFLSFLPFGINIWKIMLLGIPGQIIILMWSRLRKK